MIVFFYYFYHYIQFLLLLMNYLFIFVKKKIKTDYNYFIKQICIKNNLPNELEIKINKYLY